MNKIIATILTAAFLVAIVATSSHKVTSPSYDSGITLMSNKGIGGGTFTQ